MLRRIKQRLKLLMLKALILMFLTILWIFGLLALTDCAPTQRLSDPVALRAEVPGAVRAPCPRVPRPDAPTVGELAGFSVRQEAAINVCEAYKDAAVAIMDAHNLMVDQILQRTRPKPWWKIW